METKLLKTELEELMTKTELNIGKEPKTAKAKLTKPKTRKKTNVSINIADFIKSPVLSELAKIIASRSSQEAIELDRRIYDFL